MEHSHEMKNRKQLAKWLFIGYAVFGYILSYIFMGLAVVGTEVPQYLNILLSLLTYLSFSGALWAMKPLLKEQEKSVLILLIIAFVLPLVQQILLYGFNIFGLTNVVLSIVSCILMLLGFCLLKNSRKTKDLDDLLNAYTLFLLFNIVELVCFFFVEQVNEYYYNYNVYIMGLFWLIIKVLQFALGVYLVVGFVRMFNLFQPNRTEIVNSKSSSMLSQGIVGLIASVCVCAFLTFLLFANINLIKF